MSSAQYNAALAIAGIIRGTSKEKLYHNVDLKQWSGGGFEYFVVSLNFEQQSTS